MTQPNDGGPAFPCVDAKGFVSQGMSLRDWLAGQALAGIMANPKLLLVLDKMRQDPAICAYDVAILMIEERAKR